MAKNTPLLVDIGEGLSIMVGMPALDIWKTENRPDSPKRGTFGFNQETNNLEYWDGSAWFVAALGGE